MKPAVILVSPKGAANVGGVARLMGNFGLRDLRIVDPRVDLHSTECRERSLGAYPIIQEAKVFQTLAEAQRGLQITVAFSMQSQTISVPSYTLSEFVRNEMESCAQVNWGFVFGREDNGLEADELLQCNFVVWIPTEKNFPSINLTSSVAIALYNWFSYFHKSEVVKRGDFQPPKKEDEELFFISLRNLLLEIGFMKAPSDHILDDFRNMFRRSRLSDRDLRILFGVISDIGRTQGIRLIPKNEKG